MQKTYDTLYARSSTGAVLIWFMEQDNDLYRTTSGQIDGKSVSSEWTLALPKNVGKKNETSGIEQATLEIIAQYKKKKKEKYKESINDIDVKTFISPMRAKNYKDYKDSINIYTSDWIAQTKYNGMRCVATKDGLFSRSGEPIISTPHIHEALKPIFEKYPDVFLDGELFNNDLRTQLNEIIKLCRKTVNITPEDLLKSEQMVRYYVYDVGGPYYSKEFYPTRKAFVNAVVNIYPYVKFVENYTFSNEEELQSIYQKLVADDQEGIMLRKLSAPYQNKKTKDMLKLKPEDDDECDIISVHDADGNWSNKAKSFTVKWKDKIFDVSFKGSMPEAEIVWNEQDKWIGTRKTFKYNGLTGLGVPNFGRIDYHNCIRGDV